MFGSLIFLEIFYPTLGLNRLAILRIDHVLIGLVGDESLDLSLVLDYFPYDGG